MALFLINSRPEKEQSVKSEHLTHVRLFLARSHLDARKLASPNSVNIPCAQRITAPPGKVLCAVPRTNTPTVCSLWFGFEISVINAFACQAPGVTEFKETKMDFIFFFFFCLQMIHQFHSSRLQTAKFQSSEEPQSVKRQPRVESEDARGPGRDAAAFRGRPHAHAGRPSALRGEGRRRPYKAAAQCPVVRAARPVRGVETRAPAWPAGR